MLFTFSDLHITAVEVEAGWKQDGSRTGEKEPNAIRPVTYRGKRTRCSLNHIPWDESRCLEAVPVFPVSLQTNRDGKVEKIGLNNSRHTQKDRHMQRYRYLRSENQSPYLKKRCKCAVSTDDKDARSLGAISFFLFFPVRLLRGYPKPLRQRGRICCKQHWH